MSTGATQKLAVIFYWHIHQPFYKEADSGQYHLPWVYLHAMKDYTDIATLLSQVPGARSVVNFVPSLMIQIDDYATQIQRWLSGSQDSQLDPLLTLITSLLAEILKHYRKLQADGKVELSTTPYAHPIIPLLLNFKTAWETVPDALLPDGFYPGGKESSIAHIKKAREVHVQYFGTQPAGCWPAEGALSSDTTALLDQDSFKWTATGESVLHHSLKKNIREDDHRLLYQPWRVTDHAASTVCFFSRRSSFRPDWF